MNFALILVAMLLMGAICSICMAETFIQKTGPFTVKVTSDESVDFTAVNNPAPMDNYNGYEVDMDVGNSTYWLEIQDYGKSIDIDANDLMSAISIFNPVWSKYYTGWEYPEVGGKPGIMGIIGQGEKKETAIPYGLVLLRHILQMVLVPTAHR